MTSSANANQVKNFVLSGTRVIKEKGGKKKRKREMFPHKNNNMKVIIETLVVHIIALISTAIIFRTSKETA